MSEYKVALDVYNGPLDLLLFLIRREEIDIYNIPIARVTEQYLEYIEVLKEIDPEHVSEFLVLAATLMEIKSRMLLPRPPVEEEDDEIIDPRKELIRQLLEYKKFKDAADDLEYSAHVRAQQHARSPVMPVVDPDELEVDDLDIWDLVDAFRAVLEQVGQADVVHHVGIDDTPIALHAEDILDSLAGNGGARQFEEIFIGRSKPEMIGLFLALLELIRRKRIRVSQDQPFGPITVYLLAVPDGKIGLIGDGWDDLENGTSLVDDEEVQTADETQTTVEEVEIIQQASKPIAYVEPHSDDQSRDREEAVEYAPCLLPQQSPKRSEGVLGNDSTIPPAGLDVELQETNTFGETSNMAEAEQKNQIPSNQEEPAPMDSERFEEDDDETQ